MTELEQDYAFGGQTFAKGSYVVWMNQARRGLADTALALGVDVSERSISVLYAPPAAWSHGYLWGADVDDDPPAAPTFAPLVERGPARPTGCPGGVEPGLADRYALELDSPTAVRTLNRLIGDGVAGKVALGEVRRPPTGQTLAAGSARVRGRSRHQDAPRPPPAGMRA